MGGRWAFFALTGLAFGGRAMGFFHFNGVGFRWAGDGLFSLLAGLAFGGRTVDV